MRADMLNSLLKQLNSSPAPLQDLNFFVEAFSRQIAGSRFVVGVTHVDECALTSLEDYHATLEGMGWCVPVFEVDARDGHDMRTLVKALPYSLDPGIMEPGNAAAARAPARAQQQRQRPARRSPGLLRLRHRLSPRKRRGARRPLRQPGRSLRAQPGPAARQLAPRLRGLGHRRPRRQQPGRLLAPLPGSAALRPGGRRDAAPEPAREHRPVVGPEPALRGNGGVPPGRRKRPAIAGMSAPPGAAKDARRSRAPAVPV